MATGGDQVSEELAATGAAVVAAPCGCASTVGVAPLAAAVVALAITAGSRWLFSYGGSEATKRERAKGRRLLSRESCLGALGPTMFGGLAWSAR